MGRKNKNSELRAQYQAMYLYAGYLPIAPRYTFHFWMDGDPIPFRNFWIGMGSVVVQFRNWTNSGMLISSAASFLMLEAQEAIMTYWWSFKNT
jgi:hypothetical protein